MAFGGFAHVLAHLIRGPGVVVIDSGFALKALGVEDESALAMIIFNQATSIFLIVGGGLIIRWRSGTEVTSMVRTAGKVDEPA